jgi:hypothetical protein
MSLLSYFKINYVSIIYSLNSYSTKINYKNTYNLFYVYKYVFATFKNTIQSNILISLKYHLLLNILKTMSLGTYTPSLNYKITNNYLNSIQTTTIVFHKNKYTQLVFFFLNILLNPYINLTTTFEIKNHYIPLNQTLNLLKFVNLYYFKIRNV